MFRLVVFALAVARVLATAHPTFADPRAARASDQAQAPVVATEQPAPPPATSSGSSDATATAAIAEHGKDLSPVGFGWG